MTDSSSLRSDPRGKTAGRRDRVIRDVPDELWEAVKARALKEQPPTERGRPLHLSYILMRLMRLYALYGIAAVEAATSGMS